MASNGTITGDTAGHLANFADIDGLKSRPKHAYLCYMYDFVIPITVGDPLDGNLYSLLDDFVRALQDAKGHIDIEFGSCF